ncbi:hypothetical protein DXG01_013866 [Tephrocybe rancida]|nr:hypothetical protein DXG01_013866 [Tephrocybe rancida]
MDAVSTISSLCSLAVTIITWIDQLRSNKETLSQISTTVTTIHSILVSFQENAAGIDLDPSLLNALIGLGDALSRTKEHIVACRKARRGHSIDTVLDFLVPARVSQQLFQDQAQLSHQLTVILFSFSSSSFIRERFSLPDKKADPLSFRAIRNQDVFEFWRDYLGQKVLYAPSDRFSEALNFCFGSRLSDIARRRLILCLDEFRIGGVAASTLERFVGESSLKQAVEKFQSFDSTPSVHEHSNDPRLPLLLWVDDKPENNKEEVQYATSKGVNIHQFPSTALLKAWMEDNEDFLRANDNADSIRFISDTARYETHGQLDARNSYLNITAGENIARYLRGHLYRAPLLIFCGAGIIYTQYVNSYEATGSTCRSGVVRDYIAALSRRTDADDKDWQGYNVIEPGVRVINDIN